MADTAKHLIEEVIPEVPVRQWVLSMPYTYRFLLATNLEFLRKALAIFHRTINRYYENKSKGFNLKNPKAGAITVVQRFGGALNLYVHFHTIYTDGVFHENFLGEEVFREVIPTHGEVVRVTGQLKKRLIRLMAKFEDIVNDYESPADIQVSSVQNRDEKFQLPLKIGKVCDPSFKDFVGKRCCYDDGFSLHANVKIFANPRVGLENMSVYFACPNRQRSNYL